MGATIIELVNQALTGNTEAQTQLYLMTKNKAYYLALQLLKNPQDAEDVLQDAYITAFSKLDSLDNANRLQGWLDTIVINRAKDVLKKKKPIIFTDMKTSDEEEYEPEIVDERIEFQPQENLDYQETKRLVQIIIDELSEEQRIAVMLYYYKEMSVAEIAAYTECSTGTIKSRLNYARKSIKAKVEDLEKKGTKLYTIPVLPFLYWLFHTEAEQMVCTSALTITSEEIVKATVVRASVAKASAAKAGGIGLSMKAGIAVTAISLGVIGGVAVHNTFFQKDKPVVSPEQTELEVELEPSAENSDNNINNSNQAATEPVNPDPAVTNSVTVEKKEIQSFDEKVYYDRKRHEMVEQNGVLYYKEFSDTQESYIISRNLYSGETTKLVTEIDWISQLRVTGDYIYYLLGFDRESEIKRVPINGGNTETILKGYPLDYIDDEGYLYSTDKNVLYHDFTTNMDTEITTGNYEFIARIGDTVYYLNPEKDYVTLYSYDMTHMEWKNISEDKNISGRIIEIQKVNGLLYCTAGILEEGFDYFSGSLYCINTEGDLEELASQTSHLFHMEGKKIFYSTVDQHFSYDTVTGELAEYEFPLLPIDNGISIEEIGAVTYQVRLENSEKVSVYTYPTGTKEENKKELTSISYPQKSDFIYNSLIEKVGEYLIVDVFETNSDWVGTASSWYVINTKGEILAEVTDLD